MPSIEINGVKIAYRESGNANQPTIVFTHSLLWDSHMFDDLISLLADRYHIVNIDQHGHGQSGYREGLTLNQMAADYGLLLDQLKLSAVHWAGLSMGGMVGMRLALQRPELIGSLILMDTSARPEPEEMRENGMLLAEGLRAGQAAALSDAILPLFFAPITYREQPDLIEAYRTKLIGYREIDGIHQATLAVFNREDLSERLAEIKVPTLVLVGDQDDATPPEQSEWIASRIANAKLVVIANAGHMSATEKPNAVAEAIEQQLEAIEQQLKAMN